ncbi:serine--tRNA ligase [Ancylobacter defluvii]|uniref:Serine--tRNA ligase n=1 Tax=Ancylobacter defluvii TaxID=1282440 RepID=A0A9W6NAI4_9HYPH|nr:serine--tRNA ligase [Ancylobacter defluvii]MBS7587910.1 serine--tRNA ligase [Ancylobacter defluvii]GLK83592.1 serine--tRNA ligase [Ancylobacter defluvii]
MHDIKWIREDARGLVTALVRRGTDEAEAQALVDGLIALDARRRDGIVKLEELQARRNAASKEIGAAKKSGDNARAEALMAEVNGFKTEIPAIEADVKAAEAELHDALAAIPNAPLAQVPDGRDEHDNVPYDAAPHAEIEGSALAMPAIRTYAFAPKQHFEIGEALGQMDFEAAAKLSGARFVVLKSQLARLERAIGQFFINTHTEEHGYTEVAPPVLVKDEAMFGTAQLPKFREDQFAAGTLRKVFDFKYYIEKYPEFSDTWNGVLVTFMEGRLDELEILIEGLSIHLEQADFANLRDEVLPKNLWLIPTAEVPLTNLVAQSILAEDELPLRFTALTPCFRAEAGAAGRDTRGMIRQHQFNKVEMVSITAPEKSLEEQERMLACAQAVLKKLGLHHRVVTLCTGDMGFASARTFDIEVWLPGQNAYREISSVSTCSDFQARRMNARYRPKDSKGPRFVHTLNGSGVAVGRAMVAILETYQNEDGSVSVPDALVPYMGGRTRIAAN